MSTSIINEDWEILKKFLPIGWDKKACVVGALARKRKIVRADILLRLLLIHLADGKSLRTTSAYAKEAGLCNINDAALLHRLKSSSEWLQWMAFELTKELRGQTLPVDLFRKFRIRLVDGSSVSEQGSTGTDWRIHYCFQLSTFQCDSYKITSPKEGETFQRYSVNENDLLIGDRGYCQRKGILHVLTGGGEVLVRFHSSNLPLFTRKGKSWDVLYYLRSLSYGEVGLRMNISEVVHGRVFLRRKDSFQHPVRVPWHFGSGTSV